jgi:WD40 repeat protein
MTDLWERCLALAIGRWRTDRGAIEILQYKLKGVFIADAIKSGFCVQSTVYTLAFSMCGRWLASGGAGGELRVWDLSTGAPAALPPSHTAPVHALAFSRDGTILSSGNFHQQNN